MLVSRIVFHGSRYRREYSDYMPVAQPFLCGIRDQLARDNKAIPEDAWGVKGWVLPPWYFRRRAAEIHGMVEMSDYLSYWFSHPTVVSIGGISSPMVPSTWRSWGIGKGLIGETILYEDSEGFRSIWHAEELKSLLSLSRRNRRKADPALLKQRKKRDIRALVQTYGTGVGVGLRVRPNAPAFGCVTADTPAKYPLTKDEAKSCGDQLVSMVPALVEALVNNGYPIPTA